VKKDIGVLLDAMTVLGDFSAWLGVDGHLKQRFAWSVPERNLLKCFWFIF
jgi:hypothetical protein